MKMKAQKDAEKRKEEAKKAAEKKAAEAKAKAPSGTMQPTPKKK
jgi:hypothetical protein